jgi:hypothetical protein
MRLKVWRRLLLRNKGEEGRKGNDGTVQELMHWEAFHDGVKCMRGAYCDTLLHQCVTAFTQHKGRHVEKNRFRPETKCAGYCSVQIVNMCWAELVLQLWGISVLPSLNKKKACW